MVFLMQNLPPECFIDSSLLVKRDYRLICWQIIIFPTLKVEPAIEKQTLHVCPFFSHCGTSYILVLCTQL